MIFCCQSYADLSLKAIAKEFGFNHIGSVSSAGRAIRENMMEWALEWELEAEMSKAERVLSVIK